LQRPKDTKKKNAIGYNKLLLYFKNNFQDYNECFESENKQLQLPTTGMKNLSH